MVGTSCNKSDNTTEAYYFEIRPSYSFGTERAKIFNGGGYLLAPPTTMSCLAWNCCGLGSPRSILELQSLISTESPNILFLMEIELQTDKLLMLRNTVGFSCGMAVDRQDLGGELGLFWKIMWTFLSYLSLLDIYMLQFVIEGWEIRVF